MCSSCCTKSGRAKFYYETQQYTYIKLGPGQRALKSTLCNQSIHSVYLRKTTKAFETTFGYVRNIINSSRMFLLFYLFDGNQIVFS